MKPYISYLNLFEMIVQQRAPGRKGLVGCRAATYITGPIRQGTNSL
jgi:hypothetical protein